MKRKYFNVKDIFVILFCLGGTAALMYFLYKDINQTLKKNADPIAAVTFKENTVQRHFSDRVLWDRLQNKSDIYSGDVIRTANESDVNVIFDDKNSFVLGENTLIQVFKNGRSTKIDLSHGYLSIVSEKDGNPVTLTSGGEQIVLEAGSVLNAQNINGEALSLNVTEGTATITKDGEKRLVRAGETLNENGSITRGGYTAHFPLPSQNFINAEGNKKHIDFEWSGTALAGEFINFEIAADRNFLKIIHTAAYEQKTYNADFALEKGSYWWRVYPASFSDEQKRKIMANKFSVTEAHIPVLIAPAQDAFVSGMIHFLWQDADANEQTEGTYLLELAATDDFSQTVISRRIDAPFFNQTLEDGSYFWRVRRDFNTEQMDEKAFSETFTFTVHSGKNSAASPLPKIKLIFPEDGGSFSTLQLLESPINFRYKAEVPTARTKILLFTKKEDALSGANGISILDADMGTQNFTLMHLEANTYYWTVQGEGANGEDISAVGYNTFTIRSAPSLAAPRNLQPAAYQANAQVLQKNRSLRIFWDAVSGANTYIVNVHKANLNGTILGIPIYTSGQISTTTFLIPDLLSLGEGDFVYRVQALNRDATGSVLQDGHYARGTFKIDLRPLEAPGVNNSGDVYGK